MKFIKLNWPATVGIFTGVLAKEVVVGALDAIYSEFIIKIILSTVRNCVFYTVVKNAISDGVQSNKNRVKFKNFFPKLNKKAGSLLVYYDPN